MTVVFLIDYMICCDALQCIPTSYLSVYLLSRVYEEGEILSLRAKTKESTPLTGEPIVARFFKCIDSKDLDGILDLFDYDAVVYEPFSNVTGGLKGSRR